MNGKRTNFRKAGLFFMFAVLGGGAFIVLRDPEASGLVEHGGAAGEIGKLARAAAVGPLAAGPRERDGTVRTQVVPGAGLQSAPSDPLMDGVYADGIETIKARFLSGGYDKDCGAYLSAFAGRLAKEAPEAGFRWLLSLESNGDLQRAAAAYARELQLHAPDKLEWALQQPMPVTLYRSVASGAVAAMSGDLDAATGFIRQVARSPVEADWLARSLLITLSQDRGAEGCVKLMQLGDAFPNAVPSEQYGEALYHLWSADPGKAITIMESKQDFQTNPQVFASFTALYARQDLEAASRWVSELPDGLPKDCAIGSIAHACSTGSPLTGLRWAVSIRDSGLRPQIMTNLVELSAWHDPQATSKVIEDAGFSAEETASWMGRIEQQAAKLR